MAEYCPILICKQSHFCQMCLYLNIRNSVGRNVIFSIVRAKMYYIAVRCLAASPESRNTAQLFFRQKLKEDLKSIVNLQLSAETLHISRILIPIITEWQWCETKCCLPSSPKGEAAPYNKAPASNGHHSHACTAANQTPAFQPMSKFICQMLSYYFLEAQCNRMRRKLILKATRPAPGHPLASRTFSCFKGINEIPMYFN